MNKHTIMGAAIGGLGYGVLEKAIGDSIPVIPLLGKPGTIAGLIYMFGGSNKLLADIGVAAAAIAGYQLGTEGKIHGDYEHGLASEA